MKYLFSFLLIISILLSNIYGLAVFAQEAKTTSEMILINFPGVLKKVWQEEALVIWQRMLNWFQNIWQKIASFLGKEVEIRKPEVKEEFEKEKQEMREEIPKVTKSLWQRFKELIK